MITITKIPQLGEKKFKCPHCNSLAQQNWNDKSLINNGSTVTMVDRFIPNAIKVSISTCQACGDYHLWYGNQMLKPSSNSVEVPTQDMPPEVKKLYLEARNVYSISPKSAAALLRLAIQILFKELGEEGKNINKDIGNLVKRGLDVRIQKALDIVRITGNNAVHPGELNLDENPDIAYKLFGLLNFIVENMITQPKYIDSFFDEMPEGAKKGIENRDK